MCSGRAGGVPRSLAATWLLTLKRMSLWSEDTLGQVNLRVLASWLASGLAGPVTGEMKEALKVLACVMLASALALVSEANPERR